MLTKSNFTGDEWNQLLRLFNIMDLLIFPAEDVDVGKKTRERICLGEIDASEFGIEKSERESISHAGFGFFSHSPENYGMPSWNSDPFNQREIDE